MKTYIIPLVDWGMGATLIGVFALVCIVLSLVVINMVKGDKKNKETSKKD
ncbi:hypothetical protein CLV86_0045 [Lacinutrix venerupis]|nr:hypothetical protein [Lacinutrix venerupis]RLJ68658.1 hypothetical protein CLV86_0045 [Lacinutrix venerupis]